ncbi:hypothetical protein L596_006959 [Steinernema carpocapsae]|uniref:Uncharacterized protein n=1 Tax=Steinernema carpocapsae TaxID=34508 RepID=A0A4U5P7N0_STECR|nr:hypothetical protein L596_006959 [Steinernema carpocapsae]
MGIPSKSPPRPKRSRSSPGPKRSRSRSSSRSSNNPKRRSKDLKRSDTDYGRKNFLFRPRYSWKCVAATACALQTLAAGFFVFVVVLVYEGCFGGCEVIEAKRT